MKYHVKQAALSLEPADYVLSDSRPDRNGDIIEAKGWQFSNFAPAALLNHSRDAIIGKWENIRIKGDQLIGRLALAEEGTSPVVNMVRSFIRQGLLETVSVGFRSLKREPIDEKDPWGAQHFLETELLEGSLVAIPANPRARRIMKEFISEDEAERLFDPRFTGEPAETRRPPAKGKPMKISDGIVAKKAELTAIDDKLAEIKKRVEETGDMSDDDAAALETLKDERETVTKSLSRLEALETQLSERIKTPPAPAVVKPESVGRKNRGIDLILKAAVVHYLAHVGRQPVMAVQKERYGEDRELDMFMKAASAPAMTTVVGWAAELVVETVAAFMETLKPVSVFPRLAALGLDLSFNGLAPIKIPYRKYGTGSGSDATSPGQNKRLAGAFVGEGAPIPVRQALFAALTLNAYKMAVISTFTKEMAESSTPQIEALIREAIVEDTAWALDTALLSDEAAIAGIRPAGIYNGLTPLTPAAAGPDAAVTDIKALVGAITAAGGGRTLAWIMNPAQALALELTTNAGIFYLAELMSTSSIFRNVITSLTQPAGEVTLIDCADFASAGGNPGFDVSDQATLHMDDGTYPAAITAPSVKPIVGAAAAPPALADIATPVRSLWQTASIGVRMIMPVSWGMRRTGMVQFMQGVNW